MEEKALVVSAIVMPAVTKEEAVKAFRAYQELAAAILTKDDVQNISGKEFKKKSFWRKCQRFFNLSTEIKSEVREEINGAFTYKFVVRATAPNGAYMDATGACSSDEKGLLKTEHNTRATAETRAKNRAIADLVAFGEVSAEEVTAGHTEDAPDGEEIPPKAEPLITEKQVKLVYARWKAKAIPDDEVKTYLLKTYAIEHTKEIKAIHLDAILKWVEDYKK